ncbi:hypothetical protein Nepgr_027310 [Nepenthes gracilis]|uniref:25S rRNA (uridine-N(3))-methyltransferase BMT5-like domain-containing protein n=1 Tax=Nepenthes gracilis TaxID=150966 RepID=A0AAD3Y145_NEPGR|nr:hypothetical protein Nepgr_027310 [Nepenthes gracilis]
MGQVISTALSWLRALKKGKGRQNERIFPVTPCSKDVYSLWQQNSRSFLDSFTEDFRINVKDLTTVCNDATINRSIAPCIIDVVVDPSTITVKEEDSGLPCHDEKHHAPIASSSYEDFGTNVKDTTTVCNDATINPPIASDIIDVVVDPSIIILEEEDSGLPCQEEKKFVVLEEKVPPEVGAFGEVEVVISKDGFIERLRKPKVEEIIRRKGPYISSQKLLLVGEGDFLRKQKVEEIIRIKGPYTSSQKMLLVGEGDFSFSACLAVCFGSAANMMATSLNSTEFLLKNYKKARSNILKLKSRGCTVIHGVDATQMASCYSLNAIKFDRIIFNFSHAGVFRRDDASIRKHQKLIGGFLKNAKKMIAADGQIHITHKSNSFFREWAIEMLAVNEGLRLIEAFRFNYRDYEGYSTKFGFGGDGSFDCNPSKTYIFASA